MTRKLSDKLLPLRETSDIEGFDDSSLILHDVNNILPSWVCQTNWYLMITSRR